MFEYDSNEAPNTPLEEINGPEPVPTVNASMSSEPPPAGEPSHEPAENGSVSPQQRSPTFPPTPAPSPIWIFDSDSDMSLYTDSSADSMDCYSSATESDMAFIATDSGSSESMDYDYDY